MYDHSKYVAKWYQENREHVRERMRRYNAENRYEISARTRRKRFELRQQVVSALGGRCRHCGFDDSRALQVDHVNGGGSRRPRGLQYYRRLLKAVLANSPEYQLLCANCNWIKRSENGEDGLEYARKVLERCKTPQAPAPAVRGRVPSLPVGSPTQSDGSNVAA